MDINAIKDLLPDYIDNSKKKEVEAYLKTSATSAKELEEYKTLFKGFKADIYTEDSQFQDFYKLNIEEKSDIIDITSDAEAVFKAYRKDCLEKNPNKKRNCYNTSDLTEFNYVLYVPKNAKFKISSINGDLKSEVIEGDLELNTINGEIDLKVANSSIIAETIHGDIYANETLDLISQDKHIGSKVWSKSSTAKNKLKLNTVNGNLYLR